MLKQCLVAFVLSLFCCCCALLFGAADLPLTEVVSCAVGQCSSDVNQTIFWNIRLPRVVIGFMVGAGLAIAGASLQTVTGNALADPYLFGVVSGAGLGASVATLACHWFSTMPMAITLPLFAFLGALSAVLFVQALVVGTLGKRTELMLLAGVAVSFMFGAISHFILFLAEPMAANTIIFWLMGSVARAEPDFVLLLLPVLVVSFIVLFAYGPRMDSLLLGDESATSLGVNVPAMRSVMLVTCALLTAVIVAYCGGIGFVGLMIPHIVRYFYGSRSRPVLVGSLFLGGSFIVVADSLARSVLSTQEVPLGVITAAAGSVFFLFAMKRYSQY